MSHLTHGSTLESRAEMSKSGRRIVRGTLRLKKSGTNRRPFSEILMDYGTKNIDLREDSEGGVRDTEVHDFDRTKTGLRSEVNIELNSPPKLRGARSRLYRRRFLQVNTRWKALAEIYTMHSLAPFFNLKISAKNRQHFFANEYMCHV